MKKWSRWTAILWIGVILFYTGGHAYVKAQENTVPDLYAISAVLMDGDSKRVLYEKNGQEVRPMASTTKIMTCILVLEKSNPDEIVEVSAYAQSMTDVQLNMMQGEQYYVKDL